MFYMTLLEEYLCIQCNKNNYNIESSLKITLKTKLFPYKKEIDVWNLLSDHFSHKHLNSGELICDYCSQPYIFNMKTYLIYTPEIICIHLDKICEKNKKDSREIKPLYKLDLSMFTASSIDSSDCEYMLYATINHIGTQNSGHYTANVLLNDCFYKFDDQHVGPISPKEIFKNSIGLFYIKRFK